MRLKVAEEEMFRNPDVKRMIEEIREMWEEDDNMTVAFAATASSDTPVRPGASPPRTAAWKVRLPRSRIPELLEMLTQLPGPGLMASPLGMPPPRGGSNPLMARNPLRVEAKNEIRATPPEPAMRPPIGPPKAAPGADKAAIEKAEREVEAMKIKLGQLRETEEDMRAHRNEFAVPSNRLRAERLLRELPGAIEHLEHRIVLMREGVL